MKNQFKKWFTLSLSKGFTLIELLIVIAIIGILTALVIPNFNNARERARDTRRKADLSSIQQAIRLYYNDNQSFPLTAEITSAWGGSFASATNTYMTLLPRDPLSVAGSQINYVYNSDGSSYILVAQLENLSDPDITSSQTRCPTTYVNVPGVFTKSILTDYVVCEE